MKRNAKIRLTLNRETLRNLNPDELTAAPGGGTPILTAAAGCVLVTNTCINCVTQTCPTRCGQTYCFYV
jgi:hypothetical protein